MNDAGIREPGPDGSPVEPPDGTSGDPLLKRLVDLAKVGWEADLILFSNGLFIRGRLISGVKFRAALAESIVAGSEHGRTADLDALVGAAVIAEDPPIPDDEDAGPEPRFIHLADVRIRGDRVVAAPYLRLRLPAVSGFWISKRSTRVRRR